MKKSRFALAAGMALLIPGISGSAQQTGTTAPSAPQPQNGPSQAAQPMTTVQAFPPVNLKNFTATSPTVDEVNGFLKAMWGYDENRTWSVAAIAATSAPGVAKVVVYVADKTQPGKGTQTVFYTTPDGKHAISDGVIDFGVKPFADERKLLQDRANGAARGAKSNELLLVEFADLQCPHCREAQQTMENLAQDFPQARIVFENFPLTEIHPYAFRAAAEGECVRKAKGDAAFFTYAKTVYDLQEGLTPARVDATLSSAVTKAGGDPAAAATCAAGPEAKAAVEAEMKLGKDAGVDQTPLLAVNGHMLPATAVPYEVLKKIVAFQAAQDGIAVRLQPTLTELK